MSMQSDARAERKAMHDRLRARASSIVATLDGWTLEPDTPVDADGEPSHRAYIRRSVDGLRIALNFGWRTGRLQADHAEQLRPGEHVPYGATLSSAHATFDPLRSPAAIGRAILSKVVPPAEAIRDAYAKVRASTDDYAARSEATLAALGKAGAEVHPRRDHERDDRRAYMSRGDSHARMSCNGDNVRFEAFSVDRATAVALVRLLANAGNQ